MKYLMFVFALLLLNSCAFHRGMITASTNLPNKGTYKYVDVATGYSKAIYIFGIGGLNRDALINEAKRNLYFSYPLQKGQSFENLTLDIKTVLVWPYCKVAVIAIADVLERDSSFQITYSKNYSDLLIKSDIPTVHNLSLNETVVFYDNDGKHLCKVMKLNFGSVVIFYVKQSGAIRVREVGYERVIPIGMQSKIQDNSTDSYSANPANELKIGDKVTFYLHSDAGSSSYSPSVGKIVGLGSKTALVNLDGKIIEIDLIRLTKK